MNRTERKLHEAREATIALRTSSEKWWPALRELLRGLQIDPQRAAIGDIFQEQLGPFVVVVTAEGRVVAIQLELLDLHDTSKIAISHTRDYVTSEPRFAYPLGAYAAQVLLEEESPGSFDPIAVLAEAAGRRTSDMRADEEYDWSRLRAFLTGRGIDPDTSVLAGWRETYAGGQPGVRVGTILAAGRWYRFTASVTSVLGPLAEITSWEENSEEAARAEHGAEIDGALRLAEREAAGG